MSDNETTVRTEKYELMTVFFPDLGESGILKELDEIKQHLTSSNGEVFHEDIWGNRDLAYKIKKQSEGYYIVLNFTYPTEKISELEKSLNINPAVIRYLLVKTPINYDIKSLADYQAEEERSAKEEELKKAEKEEKKNPVLEKKVVKTRKVEETIAPEVEKVEPVEKKKEVKKEVEAEKEEKPLDKSKKVAESKISLDEFDKKLKSIIDDPDITL